MEKNIEAGVANPAFIDENEIQEQYIEKEIKVNVENENVNESDFEDLDVPEFNVVQKYMNKAHVLVSKCVNSQDDNTKYKNKIKYAKWILVAILCKIYFICSIVHFVNTENVAEDFAKNSTNTTEPYQKSIEWCDGFGFLIILIVIIDSTILYNLIIKPLVIKLINTKKGQEIIKKLNEAYEEVMSKSWTNLTIYLAVYASILIFLLVDTANDRRRLASFFGLKAFVLLAVLFSNNPARIRWRSVVWGLTLQFIFGLIILRWQVGRQVFQCLGDKMTTFLGFTENGSSFVYGFLIEEGVFMFKVLSVIFFFSFMTSMLFYMGYMQWLISKIGWSLQWTIGTTPCESMNAAANIFLGQTEAPLIIKPFMDTMTNSELHCVMASGMATIAGSVLAAYISFNISASHLLSASVMSAPAALAAAKLLYPETKKTKTSIDAIDKMPKGQEANVLDAASQGAANAVFLVANIGGTLIAVLAFIAFLNGLLSWFCALVGYDGVTIEFILGKIFIPFAWFMGVEYDNLETVGQLLGVKSFVNEFVAYSNLNKIQDQLTDRSKIIATYALCGFSNPASIGIQIAGFSTLAPNRRADFSKCAIRAYCAGSLACFMTACIAGTLIESD